jgi:hypothetical protein
VAKNERHERWRRWHNDLCAHLPEIRALKLDKWSTQLAIEVEEAFADENLSEDERVAKAEQAVLSYYSQAIGRGRRDIVEECLLKAVQQQVQDEFERWKIDASAA